MGERSRHRNPHWVSDFLYVYTKIRCGAEPALSERSESNGRLLELFNEEDSCGAIVLCVMHLSRSQHRKEFGIWTLTRRIEDDASTSPCQGEVIRGPSTPQTPVGMTQKSRAAAVRAR